MRKRYIGIYGALVVSSFLLAFAAAGFFLYIAICASQNLHNFMFENLLGATIYFFDHNPVGTCPKSFVVVLTVTRPVTLSCPGAQLVEQWTFVRQIAGSKPRSDQHSGYILNNRGESAGFVISSAIG